MSISVVHTDKVQILYLHHMLPSTYLVILYHDLGGKVRKSALVVSSSNEGGITNIEEALIKKQDSNPERPEYFRKGYIDKIEFKPVLDFFIVINSFVELALRFRIPVC